MPKKTSPKPGITRDDWLAAIAEIEAGRVDRDPSVVSYYEFSEMMSIALGTARKRLEALAAGGRAVRTSKKRITADGRCRTVVAYRLTPKK